MPSSRHAGRILSSTSRAHSEYSVWSAVMGWILDARWSEFGPASESQISHLAGLDEFRHRAHRLLDRHLGVDAVQIIEIDRLDAELLEARVAGLAHVFGPAVVGLGAVRVVDVAELGADDGLVAPAFERAAEHALVAPLHVAVRGVEERHPEVHRAVHGLDLHLVVALA